MLVALVIGMANWQALQSVGRWRVTQPLRDVGLWLSAFLALLAKNALIAACGSPVL